MPSLLLGSHTETVNLVSNDSSPYDPPYSTLQKKPSIRSPKTSRTLTNGYTTEGSGGRKRVIDEVFLGRGDVMNQSLQSLPNGRSSGSMDSRDRVQPTNGSTYSKKNESGNSAESEKQSPVQLNGAQTRNGIEQGNLQTQGSGDGGQLPDARLAGNSIGTAHQKGHARAHSASEPRRQLPQTSHVDRAGSPATPMDVSLAPHETQPSNRFSSPPSLLNPTANASVLSTPSSSSQPAPPRLQHRHTLQVPKASTTRSSRDFSSPVVSTSGDSSVDNERFSPTSHGLGRISMSLGRRQTRSIHSDMYVDEILQDDDTARWTDTIRQKRASRRHRKEEEEDDRVVVGTKVDMNHVNWVTAYNMLTGIRFTVSRTNAKIDRDLTDADFDAKHKFSFDM